MVALAARRDAADPGRDRFKYVKVRVSDIVRDLYQREQREPWVLWLVQNFDYEAIGTPEVSQREGRLYCFIGWHRIQAARRAGYSEVWVKLWVGLSKDEEAQKAYQHDFDRLAWATADKFRLMLAKGDPGALAVKDICDGLGVAIWEGGGTTRAAQTSASTLLIKIRNEHGDERLRSLLSDCLAIWPNDRLALSAFALGSLLRFERYYDGHLNYHPKRIVERLGQRSVKHIRATAAELSGRINTGRSGGNQWDNGLVALTAVYNLRVPSTYQLPMPTALGYRLLATSGRVPWGEDGEIRRSGDRAAL